MSENIVTGNVNPVESVASRKRGRPRKFPANYPTQLTCSVTGKTVKTNPRQFTKQLEKSGLSVEEFCSTYVSREGRKLKNG